MGLFDMLTAAKAGLTETDPNAGIMGKINYGGVPLGVRLIAAAQALRSIERPDTQQTGLALMARYKEKSDQARKDAADLAKKQEKANMLADKLETTNPELAMAIRANPDLVDEYAKGSVREMFDAKSFERNAGLQRELAGNQADLTREGWGVSGGLQRELAANSADLTREGWGVQADRAKEDRNAQAGLTREGWAHQDTAASAQRAHEALMQDDRQTFENEKLKTERNYEQAKLEGNMERAKMIADGFYIATGQRISTDPANPTAVPVPIPGTLSGEPAPRNVPGLLQPAPATPGVTETPGVSGPSGVAPTPTAPASDVRVKSWQQHYKDPSITPTEAALLDSTLRSSLSTYAAEGRVPDQNVALGAAAETYQKILDDRTNKMEAESKVSKPGTTFSTKVEESIAKEIPGYMAEGAKAANSAVDTNALKEALKVAPQGWGAGALLGTWLPGYSASTDTVESVINRIVPTIHAPGSGSQSDLEFASAFKAMPKLLNTKEGNQIIVAMIEAKQSLVQERSAVASQMASGDMPYQDGIRKLQEINSRSIITPELSMLFDATGVKLETAATNQAPPMTKAAKAAGITAEEWAAGDDETWSAFK
jgi:hypothetical protein